MLPILLQNLLRSVTLIKNNPQTTLHHDLINQKHRYILIPILHIKRYVPYIKIHINKRYVIKMY
jgi:hypothetical protein